CRQPHRCRNCGELLAHGGLGVDSPLSIALYLALTMAKRVLTVTWLTLLVMTLLMWSLRGYRGADWVVFVVLVLVAIKGQLVIDRFMELRHAPVLWRIALSGWLFTILGVVAVLRATAGT